MRHLLVLALLASNHVAETSCMRMELKPQLLTSRDRHVPADGGIVVGYGYTTSSSEREDTNSADPSDVKWTARDANRKPIALTRTALAPGLSVLRPAAEATSFTVVNKAGKQLGSFTHDGKLITLAAPQAKSVVNKIEDSDNPRWSATTNITLELAAAAPAEAIAVIAYGEDGKALSFTGLADTHDKQLSLAIYHSGGHCGTSSPPGSGYITGKISFAYVDAFGRLSPQSKPITVKS